MQWNWFDLNWAWIGLSISVVLLILLLFTNVFRSKPAVSRWRDPVWLAWLAPAAYMVHQFEEYGIDALGVRFSFPDVLCHANGLPSYPECSVPEATFAAINVPAIWIAGIVCALLSRRHPLLGLAIYGIHFVNSFSHLGVALATFQYNPGTLTAALIQLPLSVWVFSVCFGPGRIRRSGIVAIVACGTLGSAVLLASVKLFANGVLPGPVLVFIQVANPLLSLLVLWPWEKRVLKNRDPSTPLANTNLGS